MSDEPRAISPILPALTGNLTGYLSGYLFGKTFKASKSWVKRRTVKMTDEQYEHGKKRAAAAGLSFSEYCRQLSLTGQPARKTPRKATEGTPQAHKPSHSPERQFRAAEGRTPTEAPKSPTLSHFPLRLYPSKLAGIIKLSP